MVTVEGLRSPDALEESMLESDDNLRGDERRTRGEGMGEEL